MAETTRVDALDEQAVAKHIGEVVEQVGSVDVSFNAISIPNVQLIPLVEISREDFVSPIVTGTTSYLLTARAAARRMVERGSGVILTLSASAVRAYVPGVYMGGFGVACTAIEALTKQFAAELGPRSIRAICLRLEGFRRAGRVFRPRTLKTAGRRLFKTTKHFELRFCAFLRSGSPELRFDWIPAG